METIDRPEDLILPGRSVVTIGVFDGVHRGHQEIMRAVVSDAARDGDTSVAVTFDRNPAEVVDSSAHIPYISTLQQKLRLIGEHGVDLALVLHPDRRSLSQPAEEFVQTILADALHARHVVVGSDFAFGKGRAGNVALLREMGPKLGFEVTVVRPVRDDGIAISSTVIRRILANGKVELAAKLLGRPFMLVGTVVEGERIGRTLGYPTANLESDPAQVVPPTGVYAVSTIVGGTRHIGVASIGCRPTFAGRDRGIEVYIIGFSGDIYGEQLEVAFHHRLRGEARFSSKEALIAQIGRDVDDAIRLLGEPEPDHSALR